MRSRQKAQILQFLKDPQKVFYSLCGFHIFLYLIGISLVLNKGSFWAFGLSAVILFPTTLAIERLHAYLNTYRWEFETEHLGFAFLCSICWFATVPTVGIMVAFNGLAILGSSFINFLENWFD